MSDFEIAPLEDLKIRFPGAAFSFCLFHLSQNVFMSLKKKGLATLYYNAELKTLLRCLSALAFLPVAEVGLGFDEVVAAIGEKIADGTVHQSKVVELQAHLKYFEKIYVRRLDANRATANFLFPVDGWNCFDIVLNKLLRTNNAMEGWHKQFNQKFPKKNLNLSHFIVRLKEEEEHTWQLATRHAVHPADPLRNARSSKQENSEKQISKLVLDYSNANVHMRQRLRFLCRVQYYMSKFYNPVAYEEDVEPEGGETGFGQVVPGEMDQNVDYDYHELYALLED
uniref:MULE transposase domain-containing protein n=1 Tax=Ditylenchus dipsaci TaxID=166011 RepID=A0A915ET50_9BILA